MYICFMEKWIKIKENSNYEVSNYGGFKIFGDATYANCVHAHRRVSWRAPDGLKQTGLHRLVFEYFKHDIPYKMVINHIDGNKNNNHIDNLECVTQSQNIKHAYDTGLFTTRNYGRKK